MYVPKSSVVVPPGLFGLEGISPGAKICYLALLAFCEADGRARPTTAALAQSVGVSQRSARRYLTELRNNALVRVYEPCSQGRNTVAFLQHAAFRRDDE